MTCQLRVASLPRGQSRRLFRVIFPVIPGALERAQEAEGAMRLAHEHREKKHRPGRAIRWRHGGAVAIAMAFAVALLGSLPLLAGGAAAQQQDKKSKKQEPETTGIVSPV